MIKNKLPKISFIVCMYYPDVSSCIESILKQNYAGAKEIIVMDACYEKKSSEKLRQYEKENPRIIKVIKNKEKLPEGYGKGKWMGWKKAKGEFVVIIDQDNELQGSNWITKALEPFQDKKVSGVLSRLKVKKTDSLTNQYIALQGTDPFLAYRSLDGIINTKKLKKEKNYSVIEIKKENPIITGGNCFAYRKKHLDRVGGYIQDTQNILNLLENGHNKIAIPEAYTHHKAIGGFTEFLKKKKYWATQYSPEENKNKFSYIPKSRQERKELIINVFKIVTIIPNIITGTKKIMRTREKAWALHPILPFATMFIYFYYGFARRIFTSKLSTKKGPQNTEGDNKKNAHKK